MSNRKQFRGVTQMNIYKHETFIKLSLQVQKRCINIGVIELMQLATKLNHANEAYDPLSSNCIRVRMNRPGRCDVDGCNAECDIPF